MAETVLAKRTRATPERVALVAAETGQQWTYRELSQAATRAATELSAVVSHDRRDDQTTIRIATLLPPSPAFVVAFHALQRLGWTLVGLERSQSTQELSTRIEQTEPELVLCTSATESKAKSARTGDCSPVAVDNWNETSKDWNLAATEGQSTDHISEPTTGRQKSQPSTALILFTSGTTGKPKAVRLTGRNLTASAEASAYRLGVSPGDRWLGCLPVAHMGGIAPVIRTAQYGTTLVLQSEFDAARTAECIREYRITGISLVPTQLRRLLDADGAALSPLETVLLGGAPASEELLARASDEGVSVYPTYGLTETASQVATARPEQAREFPETVGQPLYGTTVRIVSDGKVVGPNEQGEIVVSGPTVTPGYLDTDVTDSAFSEHGFHTGDVGYRDDDGRLWVDGRLDDLIQTGGELVAPSTVESVIADHPQVEDVAVVGVADVEWGERVSAVVVTDDCIADNCTEDDLREYCRERLAAYELPKTVVFADSLPRTVSGTVDREAARSLVSEELQ